MALLHWQRMSEYTADRAGLLGCQDAKVAFRTLMKLAGLPQKYYSKINTADFIAQAKTFEALERDKFAIIAKVLNMDASHPYTVMRAKQLLDWYDGGGYDQVLKNPQVLKRLCTRCSYTLKGTELFCPGCSLRLSASAGA
jgi:Zn-dependent protease with chaperone function